MWRCKGQLLQWWWRLTWGCFLILSCDCKVAFHTSNLSNAFIRKGFKEWRIFFGIMHDSFSISLKQATRETAVKLFQLFLWEISYYRKEYKCEVFNFFNGWKMFFIKWSSVLVICDSTFHSHSFTFTLNNTMQNVIVKIFLDFHVMEIRQDSLIGDSMNVKVRNQFKSNKSPFIWSR